MPADDYASASTGGALRIKGAKVKKHKKKKTGKSELEKALSTGGDPSASSSSSSSKPAKEAEEPTEDGERQPEPPQTERRKTEAERRFEEARRRKLLEMAEEAKSRPELLKTHKERVEELNTYLSKLSEHHDMPKIGPG
ncbi:unnamed protein product [Discula destructiva]